MLSIILTLTELEATASLRLTRLLALYLAAVACEETVVLQVLLIFGIDLHQSAGDAQTQSLALTSEATSVEVSLDVVLLSDLEQFPAVSPHTAGWQRGSIRSGPSC